MEKLSSFAKPCNKNKKKTQKYKSWNDFSLHIVRTFSNTFKEKEKLKSSIYYVKE